MRRKKVGLVERVRVSGRKGAFWINAKIDTGSERTSLDSRLARKIGLGPILGYVKIRSSHRDTSMKRPVMKIKLDIANERFTLNAGINDRSRLRYRAIIGKDILMAGHFLIDPAKPRPKPIHKKPQPSSASTTVF